MLTLCVSPQNTCSFISTPLCSLAYYDIIPDCQLWAKEFVRQSIKIASINKDTWLWMSRFIYCYMESSTLKPRDLVSRSFVNSTGDKQTIAEALEPMTSVSNTKSRCNHIVEINVSKYISLYNCNNNNYYYFFDNIIIFTFYFNWTDSKYIGFGSVLAFNLTCFRLLVLVRLFLFVCSLLSLLTIREGLHLPVGFLVRA
jgi:hypothetical protein